MSEPNKTSPPPAPIIGYVATAVEGKYDNMMLCGIHDAVHDAGATLLCFVGNRLSSAADFAEQGQHLFDLAAQNVDGLIITDAISKESSKEALDHFLQQQKQLPTVTIAFQTNNHPRVITDNSSGIHAAMHHLIHHHGYRRIAYISGPAAHQDAQERYKAYQDSLAENNIPLDTNLITSGNFFLISGREAMQELLARDVSIEVVLAANDYMALGAWQMLEEAGIKVPEEVAVVGFDNLDRSQYPQYSLTTVDQSFYKRARVAAEGVLDLLQGKNVPADITITTELVIRQSCGCRTEDSFEYKTSGSGEPQQIDPEQIVATMVQAAHPMPSIKATAWCQELYRTFIHDLAAPQPSAFLPAFTQILEESVYFGGDFKIWHRVLSAFKASISPALDDAQSIAQAESLWYQARLQIGLSMAQVQALLRAHVETAAERLRDLDSVFWRTTELPQLFEVIERQFPRLGVKSLYLVLYDEQPSARFARLMFAYNPIGSVALPPEGKRFRSQELLPDNLLSKHRGSTLIIEHFYFKTYSLGYAVFEVQDVKTAVCDNLSRQIGQNIQRILTLQKQQVTQEQLKERTQELQQQQAILAKRAEELEEAHTFLDTIIEHIPNALFVIDAQDLTYLRWNKATEALFGNTYDELFGKSVFDIATSPEQAQRIADLEKMVLEQGTLFEEPEFIMVDAQQQVHIVHAQKVPIFGADDTPKYLLNIMQDITERKKLEQQIQSTLERRGRYVEISIEVSQQIAAAPVMDELFHRVVHLIQGRFGYYHAQVYTLEGDDLIMQAGTGFVGKQLKAMNHKIPLTSTKSLVAHAARTGETITVANVYDEPTWLPNSLLPETQSEIAAPIKLGNQVLGVLDVQSDQTDGLDDEDQFLLRHLCGQIAIAIDYRRTEAERIRAEKARQRFTDLVESSTDFVGMADRNGRILYINRAGRQMVGLGEDEAISHCYIADFHPPDSSNRVLNEAIPTASKEGVWTGETIFTNRKTSAQIPTSQILIVHKSADGEVEYYSTVARNITDRINAEEELKAYARELERSNRELQNFAYISSHDLQEPLRKIQAFGSRLSYKYADVLDDSGQDYLLRMQDAASRMQTLIQDLLDFSRIANRTEPFRWVNLAHVVGGVLVDMQPQIEAVHADIQIGDLPTLEADSLQMRHLFQNLLNNALKFRIPDQPPVIHIESSLFHNTETGSLTAESSPQTWCQIEVSDNGIGFDVQYAEKIFAVFQRLHARTEYSGTGVGLAICRKIVERHNGTITAVSEPGQGATFIITLPLQQPEKQVIPI